MKLEQIRRCEDHWRELFAEKRPFNAHLIRWHNPNLPDQYTTNAFFPNAALCYEDVAEAYAYQRKQGLNFLQFMCPEPMEPGIAEEFQLEENVVLTMALEQGEPNSWQKNSSVVIRDVQTHDIAEELIAFHLEQEKEALQKSDYAKRQILQDMAAAKAHPEYHWLCAYLDGKLVAICHALCYEGCVEVDDLVVAPEARKQYVATTMLRHIAEHFEGIIYLHADEDDTPKEIYHKLGFVVVDRCWEYRRVW